MLGFKRYYADIDYIFLGSAYTSELTRPAVRAESQGEQRRMKKKMSFKPRVKNHSC
jgi:hypothetical protein